MKIINKDGKHFIVGTALEVGRVLTKRAKAVMPLDLGWTLSKQADEASSINNEEYLCNDCSYGGDEAKFPNGKCPECGSQNIIKAAS